jgi:tRNA(Ile)-lysidine synthase
MGPHPAVAAIRLAVRRVLNDVAAEVPDTFSSSKQLPDTRPPFRPVGDVVQHPAYCQAYRGHCGMRTHG